MDERTIAAADIAAFAEHLRRAERSRGTIENYLRHVRAFAHWLDGGSVTKEAVAAWKESLSGGGYRPGSVNAMLGALNRFLDFMGWADCRVKALKIQRRLFRDGGRELTRGEYERLDGETWEMVTAYSPDIAEARYQEHLREKGPDLKIGKDHELANYIEATIVEKECSPAAVLGYAMMEGRTFETSVSVTTIYSYIKKGLFLQITQVDLPRHGKHKQGYKKVKTKDDQARRQH